MTTSTPTRTLSPRWQRGWLALLAALVLLAPALSHAATPDEKCTAIKLKATGKKAFEKAKCHQKAVLKATTVDAGCLLKAETKFTTAIGKADSTGTCVGTATSLEAMVDAFVTAMVESATCANGAIVGGLCWYLGAAGESCNTVCANQGLAYDPATNTYVGAAGTGANCEAVLDALGVPAGVLLEFDCLNEIGCYYDGGRNRCNVEPVNPAASFGGGAPACACN